MAGAVSGTAALPPERTATGPLDHIARHRILPVVVIDDPARAAGLGSALTSGGLPMAEITLRTPGALRAVSELAKMPGMTVGAGSVVRADQVAEAADAGAAFIVTPGLSRAVLDECRTCGIPVVPGVATATEIIAALDQGVSTVKFFPAEQAGGVSTLRAFAGPFPGVRFVPTGGLNLANAPEYLALPSVLAVGGSWMVPRPALADRDFATITRLTSDALRATGAATR
jgi:2-dehydro-3-deoxyphosphogluconate aldolase/(4S)-4-hydroxy-2-oxoglutarate aldolase